MGKIAIVYGSSSGTAEGVAKVIQDHFSGADLFNADSVNPSDLEKYNYLILGTSTSGVGDLQDDWEVLLPKVEKLDLSNKLVALFALGDSASFSTSFAEGMYYIYKALKGKTNIIGAVSTDGYTFDDSDAVVDGRFVGLAIDEDNEYDLTEERIANWVNELKKHMK